MTAPSKDPEKKELFFLFFVVFLLIVRVIANVLSPLQLSHDESQYWRWADTLAWGYYSKPPMISWVIGLTTSVFGDAEWSIRLAPAFFYAVSAVVLYSTGKRLWSADVGILAGITWSLMGGVMLSSTIMSTDVGLLTFWSVALLSLFSLRARSGWQSAALLGIALAGGFLSKYAMIYFLIGMVLGLIYDRPLRKALLSKYGAASMAVFLALFTPHIIWSFQNGFKTVAHTADNAKWEAGTRHMNTDEALSFFGDQFGVFSPVQFLLLLVCLGAAVFASSAFVRRDERARLLLAFILPPLLIILVQAFISRAHANWAASAYPAACILLSAWVLQSGVWIRRLMYAGLALNLGVGLFAYGVLVQPFETQIELGANKATKRVRGWPETVQVIEARATEANATAIIVDEREIWHELDYYGRDGGITFPVRAWRKTGHPKSASENEPVTESDAENALLIIQHEGHIARMTGDFDEVTAAPDIDIDIGGGIHRRYKVFIASGFNPVPVAERDVS